MKERKPIWRSIVVWIIILGVLGVISFFVISNLVGQQYNSISTSQFESQLYEVNDSLVEDKNDFIIYSYSSVAFRRFLVILPSFSLTISYFDMHQSSI